MADAAVTFLLENVSLLLKSYVDLISGAENELQQLENELSLLQAFLKEAAKKPKKEEPFREMERQIRKVVYEAEDTIDTCLTQAAIAKTKNVVRRHFSSNRLSLAQEVKSLRETKVKPMFDKAKMDFANMEIAHGSGPSVEETRTKLKKSQSIRQDNVVGFEDEEEKITGYIMEQTKELDVVSIIGMPGLGKTTLAWKIYQSKKIRYEFPVRIWVYVSQTFSRKDVLLKILGKFDGHDMSSLSLDEGDLIEKVRGHLEEAKFFLVLDDVWSIEAWNSIEVVLPKNNWMSKVLITSRYTNVGKHANRTRVPHDLRFLTNEESWKLLQLEVFGKVDDCPNRELKRIGESIAEKCDGLPLAIVVIGGILLGQFSTTRPMNAIISDWTNVHENLNTYLIRNENAQGISDVVALSYGILPNDLRECFIYLGVFPEDYEIPVWTLTRLWIAEGFIQHKQGQRLEEIAEENLKELIDRNLVMVDKTNPNGEVKICRVHDVIRAFCISKALFKDQNLFQEIKMSKGVFDPPVNEIQNYRRLCIHSELQDFLSKQPKGPHVRSFLCFNKPPIELEAKYTPDIPDAFKLIRVMESKSIKFKKFPNGVTKLIHLRYITVSIDNLDVLPEPISKLWNLQTIVVDTNSRTLTIEANIWKMIQLRHLKTKAAIVLAIKGGEGKAGENLQTLSRLSPDQCTEDLLNRASNLKRLGIRGKLDTLPDTKSMKKLYALEKLKLVNDLYSGSVSKDRLHGLPASNWFPQYLKWLTLSATLLEWKHMSTLAKIDTLEVLKLKDRAFTGMSWDVVHDSCFPSLHFLLIADTDLNFWEASSKHFPKLRTLVLHNCGKLKEIPLGLAEPLEKLDIENLGKSAVDSARKIDELKKTTSGQPKARWGGGFKLIIGPGCQ